MNGDVREERELATLIGLWWTTQRLAYGSALLEVFLRHLRHVLRCRPRIWYLEGERGEDSLRSMAGDILAVCSGQRFLRFPYRVEGRPAEGRLPLVAWLEEAFADPEIRLWAFNARTSIAREYLEGVRRTNRRQLPWLAWADDLYAALGPALRATASIDADGRWAGDRQPSPRPRPWSQLRADVRTALRGAPPLVRSRRRLEAWLTTALPDLLRATGPMRRADLAHLLAEVLPEPVRAHEEDEDLPAAPTPREDTALREAARTAWAQLDEDQRALVRASLYDRTAAEVLAERPSLRNGTQVTRAKHGVVTLLLAPLLAHAGIAAPSEGEEAPGVRLARVAELLAEVLPEMEP